jgi:hypothetical protein
MRTRVTFLIAALASVILSPASHGAPPEIGSTTVVVRIVTGEVEQNVRQLVVSDRVHANEQISTGADSVSELIFLDETKFSVGSSTNIVLDRFVYDPEPSQSSFTVTATKGVFRFVSGTMQSNSYLIRTPTATIGVRGTTFTCLILPLRTTCSTENGSINMVNRRTRREVQVPAGQSATVPSPDGSEERAFDSSALPTTVTAEIQNMDTLLRVGRLAALSPSAPGADARPILIFQPGVAGSGIQPGTAGGGSGGVSVQPSTGGTPVIGLTTGGTTVSAASPSGF